MLKEQKAVQGPVQSPDHVEGLWFCQGKHSLKQLREFLVIKRNHVSLAKDLSTFLNGWVFLRSFQGIRDHYIMKSFQNYFTLDLFLSSSFPFIHLSFLPCLFLFYFYFFIEVWLIYSVTFW